MRVLVMGTGGLGGYYGWALASHGHDVTFVARGAHLAAIREKGLTLRSLVTTRRISSIPPRRSRRRPKPRPAPIST